MASTDHYSHALPTKVDLQLGSITEGYDESSPVFFAESRAVRFANSVVLRFIGKLDHCLRFDPQFVVGLDFSQLFASIPGFSTALRITFPI